MKNYILLFVSAIVIFFSVISCHKSNGPGNPTLAAMQGTWYIKSIRCYRDTAQNWFAFIYPTSYYKFNADKTGEMYSGSTLNTHNYFTYDMLNNDSTFSIRSTGSTGSAQLDTFVIMKLTSNEFLYHGANTVLAPYSICSHVLDSLYR